MSWPRPDPSGAAGARRPTLAPMLLVLAAALAVRLGIVATHTYVVWPDETFQYLEPAHRLLFGAGIVTWEFLDGIRSWLLPGLVAAVMAPVARLDPDPAAYLLVLRLLCVAASLVVPWVGFRLVERRCGPTAGLLAGLLAGLSTEAVYFAPAIMAEPLATDAALVAMLLGDPAPGAQPSRRRLLAAGLLFGLAASLRYQYAPVLALVALVQLASFPRRLALVAAAGATVVLLVLGGGDWLTWGTPFQSVWLNVQRNAGDGVSSAIGTEPASYYAGYYLVAWGPAAVPLLLLAGLGAWRMPVLATAATATLALHSAVPHKELRFVFLATACVPMLIGAGAGTLLARLPRLRPPAVGLPVAATLALAIAGFTAAWSDGHAAPPDAWHRFRSVLQATAAARRVSDACGLAIRTEWVYQTGGYTYWHRDAPIFYETWDDAQNLPGSTFRLRLENILDGRSVPQYPGPALAAHADRFNVLIGTPADALPGFTERACFGRGTPDDRRFCVFTRPGDCG